jgi:hypothetical protein
MAGWRRWKLYIYLLMWSWTIATITWFWYFARFHQQNAGVNGQSEQTVNALAWAYFLWAADMKWLQVVRYEMMGSLLISLNSFSTLGFRNLQTSRGKVPPGASQCPIERIFGVGYSIPSCDGAWRVVRILGESLFSLRHWWSKKAISCNWAAVPLWAVLFW